MERVTEVTKDCFGALLQLSQLEPESAPPAELVHSRMKGLVETLLRATVDAGYSQTDSQDIAYAIVAAADELALNSTDPIREHWMGHPLQFQLFQENQAGDGFFARLEAIRKDPNRTDALRVYYLCLLFGFQGRYRVRGGELELLGLTETIGKDLVRGRQANAEVLSPHGDRPADAFSRARQSTTLLYLAGGALAIALLMFGGLKLGLAATTSSAIETLRTTAPEVAR